MLELLLFLVALVVGGLGSMLGIGGGVLLIPLLTGLFGIPIKTAIGASIVSVIATSSAAGAVYVGRGLSHTRLAMVLEIAITLGALAGDWQNREGAALRIKFGMTTVALWREGRSYRTDVGDFPLEAGDALLMVAAPGRIKLLAEEPGYIVLNGAHALPLPSRRNAVLAVVITALVLLLSAANILPTAESMLAGAALLVLTGCVSMEDAYRAIEWRVVVLIAGCCRSARRWSRPGWRRGPARYSRRRWSPPGHWCSWLGCTCLRCCWRSWSAGRWPR